MIFSCIISRWVQTTSPRGQVSYGWGCLEKVDRGTKITIPCNGKTTKGLCYHCKPGWWIQKKTNPGSQKSDVRAGRVLALNTWTLFISVNLLMVYHKCSALIGCPTSCLFCDSLLVEKKVGFERAKCKILNCFFFMWPIKMFILKQIDLMNYQLVKATYNLISTNLDRIIYLLLFG